MSVRAPPASTEVHDAELVALLNRLRVLATEDTHLRIFATPAPPLERVHVLLTRNDTGGMSFPTIRHYALAPLLHPAVSDLDTEGDTTSFTLSFDGRRGRKTTQVEIHDDAFDIWGVRFEDLTGPPDILDSLRDCTPSWIPCDDEDAGEAEPPPGALVVRLFDLPDQALFPWMGGMWRYVPVLHVAVSHGLGERREERLFRFPRTDFFDVRELRRQADGRFTLDVTLRAFDEGDPFSHRHPTETWRFVVHRTGLDVLQP